MCREVAQLRSARDVASVPEGCNIRGAGMLHAWGRDVTCVGGVCFTVLQGVMSVAWFVVKFFWFSRLVLLPWQLLSWVTGFGCLVITSFAGRAVELVRLYCTVGRLWLFRIHETAAKIINAQHLPPRKG